MQKTREQIVHILKRRGRATVEELSRELGLTSVTIRHHLDVLLREGIVAAPEPFRRRGPGRPQYIYRLSPEASGLFPKNYDLLALELLKELSEALPPEEVDRILHRIAQRLADQAGIAEDADLPTRLEATVRFLNEQGYMASAETDSDGRLLLHVANCPYEQVAQHRFEPCAIDRKLLSLLLHTDPRRLDTVSVRGERCTYLVEKHTAQEE